MSRLSDSLHWLLFAAVVLTTLGIGGIAVVGVVATIGTLLGGGPLLPVLTGFVLGTFLLIGLDIVFAVALLREVTRRASLPQSQRAANWLRLVESLVPPLSRFGLADRFEPPAPTAEERRDALVEQYVDGDLSEAEFEHELDALLDGTGSSTPSEQEWGNHRISDEQAGETNEAERA